MSRFVPDDPTLELHGFDLAWPLRRDGNADLAIVSGEENTLSALPIRAATARGEIPWCPLDGIDLEDIEGGVATDGERAALRARLVEQYRSREDRLESVAVVVDEGAVTLAPGVTAASTGDTVATITAKFRSGRTAAVEVPFGGG